MKMYEGQIASRNAQDESQFLKRVLDDNMSLADQLSYREGQLKRVTDDRTESLRIGKEVKALRSLVEQQTFADDYSDKLIGFNSGAASIDSVINWLNQSKLTAKDSDVLTKIDSELIAREKDRFTINQNVIQNQTDYALKDKTDTILDQQISRIGVERNKALLADNKELVSTYDLHLLVLNKAKQENAIQKDIKNFSVATIIGYANATSTLDAFNQKISSSPASGSVKIGDVVYNSPQEFWQFKRDSFVADQSDSGFFQRFNTEQKNLINTKSSQGILSVNDLQAISKSYNDLSSRSELQSYSPIISMVKQDSLQTGANLLGDIIVNKFSQDYEFNKAIQGLSAIKSVGVNVDSSFNKIFMAASQIKDAQVQNIVSSFNQILADNPEISIEDAFKKATVAQPIIMTPQSLINKNESDLAAEQLRLKNADSFKANLQWDPVTKTHYYQANPYLLPTDPGYGIGTDVNGNKIKDPSLMGVGVVPPATEGYIPPEIRNSPSYNPNVNYGTFTPPAGSSSTPGNTNQPATLPPTPVPTVPITSQFDLGATDPQIMELQRFLNKKGFLVSSSGSGSPGNETNYFGPLTQAALRKFQAANGIVSSGDPATTGYGRLGPQTLAKIKEQYNL